MLSAQAAAWRPATPGAQATRRGCCAKSVGASEPEIWEHRRAAQAVTARGGHGLCGFGRPSGATQRRLASAGEWAAAELGTEVHLGPGRQRTSQSRGGKEGEGSKAPGSGSPNRRPEWRRELPEPLVPTRAGAAAVSWLVPGSWDSPQPWEPPAQARRAKQVDALGAGGESGVQVIVSISLGSISTPSCALSQQRRAGHCGQSWALP